MGDCRSFAPKGIKSEVATVRKIVLYRNFLYFLFLSFLFNTLISFHINLYFDKLFEASLFPSLPHGWVLEHNLGYFSVVFIFQFFVFYGRFTVYLHYIYNRICFIRWHRLQCFRIAKQGGVTRWKWHALPWLGFAAFLGSMILSIWVSETHIVLTIGIMSWWGSFHWQILRERRWLRGHIEERVDFYSFTLFSTFYLLIYIYLVNYVTSFKILSVAIMYYFLRVFPTWAHFLFGKRPFLLKSSLSKGNSGEDDQGWFSNASMFYDDIMGMGDIEGVQKKRKGLLYKYLGRDFVFLIVILLILIVMLAILALIKKYWI
ncbi:hypothetical protein [Pasteuria penetrans]|uniref:hypothetical protein n=1 Tax=Pasteuria penetrans TaxID=86005 RepID=UPI000FC2FE9C|nr:hypothetical protein [Pasteuria penetrans]